jgi:lipopolysaccharide export system permease protein
MFDAVGGHVDGRQPMAAGKTGRGMTLFERYVLRRLGLTFLATLMAVSGVVWVTRALRDLNVVTAKGQALLVFLEIVSLALPFLVVVVAPFALLIAAIQVLHAMSAASELVVVAAAGGGRVRILRPLLTLSVLVALGMVSLTTYVAPTMQRTLRDMMTSVNADLVANIIQPGRFTTLTDGLVFHIRNKAGDGTLVGLMIDDRRDDNDQRTYLAEEAVVAEAAGSTVLVMTRGTLLRRRGIDGPVSLIAFDTYGFDLTDLAPQGARPALKPSERTTYDLLYPDPTDEVMARSPGRFRGELADRLSQPLLPIAFALVCYLFLGDVRTTRQGRGLSVVGAFLAAIVVRGAHFAATSAANASVTGAVMCFVVPGAVIVAALVLIAIGSRFALPALLDRLGDTMTALVALVRRDAGGRAS